MTFAGRLKESVELEITDLTREDLSVLHKPRHNVGIPAKLRQSHHAVFKMLAAGKNPTEIATATAYSLTRVMQLIQSPAGQELYAHYKGMDDESYKEQQDEYNRLLLHNMIAAERHVSDTIAEADDADELLPVKTALAISRDAADRLGYGKHTTRTNENVDFASRLESAIKRSRGASTLTLVPSKSEPVNSHPASPPSAPTPITLKRRA